MKQLIRKAVPFIKGITTVVLPESWYTRNSGAKPSARYSYAVFMRHLVHLRDAGAEKVPSSIVELGPGTTIGLGLAGLLAGADSYTGLDAYPFCDWDESAKVFDELVELFRSRTPIPSQGEFSNIRPRLDDHSFPKDLFPDDRLDELLAPERLAFLRTQIRNHGGESIRYIAPWSGAEAVSASSQDWIISQAVMQHVTDPDAVYGACAKWLTDGGYVSHQINFGSHGITTQWNGHWAYSALAWRVIQGKRPFLLNRMPCSGHLDYLRKKKLSLLKADYASREDGIRPNQVSRDCRLKDSDLTTIRLFMVAQKQAVSN